MKRHNSGFTLIELMVTVAIVGILTSIALPQYKDYVMRARLTDAVSALSPIPAAAENHWARYRTFAEFCNPLKLPLCKTPANTKNFDYTATTQTADTLVVRADGKGAVAGFVFEIDQSGAKKTVAVPAGSGYTAVGTCFVIGKPAKCAE